MLYMGRVEKILQQSKNEIIQFVYGSKILRYFFTLSKLSYFMRVVISGALRKKEK